MLRKLGFLSGLLPTEISLFNGGHHLPVLDVFTALTARVSLVGEKTRSVASNKVGSFCRSVVGSAMVFDFFVFLLQHARAFVRPVCANFAAVA